ncbi:Maleylpyruvate isomerase [bacterium YEK0313]|nr:Maleylpyruvate isomerase [bacterium YEK0313]
MTRPAHAPDGPAAPAAAVSSVTFYGYFRSSASWRCRIAFNLKGIAPEFVGVHLRRDGGEHKKPAYRAINPQQLVPALAVGSTVLTQSLAIVEWLEETLPDPPLLPAEPLRRAAVRAFAHAIAMDIHPLGNLRVLSHLAGTAGWDAAAVHDWARHWISEGLAACELLLQGHGEHPYCFGDRPGLADLCLVPQLGNARRFGVDLDAFPRLAAVGRLCAGHPAFAAALPDRQSDAEP